MRRSLWMVMVVDPRAHFLDDAWFLIKTPGTTSYWKPYHMECVREGGPLPPAFKMETSAIEHMHELYKTKSISKELVLCTMCIPF